MTPAQAFDTGTSLKQAELAATFFRSVGDPARLRLVLCLLGGEHRVVDPVDVVGLAQSTVSDHLARLRDCGLSNLRPVGRQSSRRLSHDVQNLLLATETLLDRTGHEESLWPTAAHPAPAAGTLIRRRRRDTRTRTSWC